MTPDHIAVAIIAVISLAGTSINVYMGLYIRNAVLTMKAEVLQTVREETYSREMVDANCTARHAQLALEMQKAHGCG